MRRGCPRLAFELDPEDLGAGSEVEALFDHAWFPSGGASKSRPLGDPGADVVEGDGKDAACAVGSGERADGEKGAVECDDGVAVAEDCEATDIEGVLAFGSRTEAEDDRLRSLALENSSEGVDGSVGGPGFGDGQGALDGRLVRGVDVESDEVEEDRAVGGCRGYPLVVDVELNGLGVREVCERGDPCSGAIGERDEGGRAVSVDVSGSVVLAEVDSGSEWDDESDESLLKGVEPLAGHDGGEPLLLRVHLWRECEQREEEERERRDGRTGSDGSHGRRLGCGACCRKVFWARLVRNSTRGGVSEGVAWREPWRSAEARGPSTIHLTLFRVPHRVPHILEFAT